MSESVFINGFKYSIQIKMNDEVYLNVACVSSSSNFTETIFPFYLWTAVCCSHT